MKRGRDCHYVASTEPLSELRFVTESPGPHATPAPYKKDTWSSVIEQQAISTRDESMSSDKQEASIFPPVWTLVSADEVGMSLHLPSQAAP